MERTGYASAEYFPCHLLSQGQIVRLAESEAEQIKFIDSFFDFHSFQREIREREESLGELDRQVAVQIRARKATDKLKLEQQTLNGRIDAIDKQLKSPIFAKYRDAQKKARAAGDALQALAELRAAVGEAQAAAEAVAVPSPSDEVKDDPLVRRLTEKAGEARQLLLKQYKEESDRLASLSAEGEKDRQSWLPDFEKLEGEYNEAIKAAGGDAAKLNQQRGQLVNARNDIEAKLRKARLQAEQLRPTVERRNKILTELREREKAYTQARQERCDWFEQKSEGKIRAKVDPGSDYTDFRERLDSMKRGSYLSGDDIRAIAEAVPPSEFVRALLRYDLSRKPSDLESISSATKLDAETVSRLAEFLLSDNSYEDLLALEYSVSPTDRPQISYRLPDGSYAPLEQLSTGQKCTAFLVMTLCEGEIPIIVDQPEDSLDIRSIWDDMCLRLRTSKRARQFLFTTHNSSLSYQLTRKVGSISGASNRVAWLFRLHSQKAPSSAWMSCWPTRACRPESVSG